MPHLQWADEGVSSALCWLAIDDRKGNPRGRGRQLPPYLYSEGIAPFLKFKEPLPNQLYAFGGRNEENGPLDTVEMFDTWHGRWVICPSMLSRRVGCAAAALPDGTLLVVGGYDEKGYVQGVLNSCEVFEPAAQKWFVGSATLQRARWGHGCASVGNQVYAVGGCSPRPGSPRSELLMHTLRSCEVFDMKSNAWLPCPDLCIARAGARAVGLGDRYLAAIGGCEDVFGSAEPMPTVELYDVQTSFWALLGTHLSTPRTVAAVAAIGDHKILITGGAPSLSSVEIYSVQNQSRSKQCSEAAADKEQLTGKIGDITEGRMGGQAVALDLPPDSKTFPLCSQKCVVVVGGEGTEQRQFSSVLVYDVEAGAWRASDLFPPIPTPRTSIALCVGPGKIHGHSR